MVKVIMEEGFENGLTWEFYHQREDMDRKFAAFLPPLQTWISTGKISGPTSITSLSRIC
ncbi:MAG: hypothetical protein R2757_19815 [Draconibacterium sp.]